MGWPGSWLGVVRVERIGELAGGHEMREGVCVCLIYKVLRETRQLTYAQTTMDDIGSIIGTQLRAANMRGPVDVTVPDKWVVSALPAHGTHVEAAAEKSFISHHWHYSRCVATIHSYMKAQPAKMLKHGRAGVPMEVMGLMLGEFVDEYTVQVIDVFAMPQSGTTVTVESVDHVFQTKMVDMLKQTGR